MDCFAFLSVDHWNYYTSMADQGCPPPRIPYIALAAGSVTLQQQLQLLLQHIMQSQQVCVGDQRYGVCICITDAHLSTWLPSSMGPQGIFLYRSKYSHSAQRLGIPQLCITLHPRQPYASNGEFLVVNKCPFLVSLIIVSAELFCKGN